MDKTLAHIGVLNTQLGECFSLLSAVIASIGVKLIEQGIVVILPKKMVR